MTTTLPVGIPESGTVVRSVDPYIARGRTWFEYEIWVDGCLLEDQASAADVIEFMQTRADKDDQ